MGQEREVSEFELRHLELQTPVKVSLRPCLSLVKDRVGRVPTIRALPCQSSRKMIMLLHIYAHLRSWQGYISGPCHRGQPDYQSTCQGREGYARIRPVDSEHYKNVKPANPQPYKLTPEAFG